MSAQGGRGNQLTTVSYGEERPDLPRQRRGLLVHEPSRGDRLHFTVSMVSGCNNIVLMASLALAIGFSVPASAQQADTTVTANLVLQVQELQDEVRTLRGRLEEQDREIENLKRRQRDQYLDLDQRISDLRNSQPVLPSGAGAAAALVFRGQGPVQGPSAASGADVPEVRAPMESESAVTAHRTAAGAEPGGRRLARR